MILSSTLDADPRVKKSPCLGWTLTLDIITSVFALGGGIHNKVPEQLEFGASQRLGEVVSNHLVSGTILDGKISLGDLVSYKEVPDVDVPSPLAATCFSILFEEDGTLVVLV